MVEFWRGARWVNACAETAESRGVAVAGDFMAIHTRQRGATEKVKSEGVLWTWGMLIVYMFNIVYNYFYINEFNELNSQSFIESIKHPASNPKEI